MSEKERRDDGIWRDVGGYEGLYQVSAYGNVRSLPREITVVRLGTVVGKRVAGRMLNPAIRDGGYKKVVLSKNGRQKSFQVHRLVALAFIPNPGKKPQVNHIDGNPSNNRLENLEWATGGENLIHSYAVLGRVTPTKGKPARNRKLTLPDVIAIYQADGRQEDIAKRYGVSRTIVSRIKRKKCYKEACYEKYQKGAHARLGRPACATSEISA